MRKLRKLLLLCLGIGVLMLSSCTPEQLAHIQETTTSIIPSPTKNTLPLEQLQLPEGFHIGIFAENIPGARSMTQASDGTIFVGTRTQGNVYALRDTDGDMYAEETTTILQGRAMPNGVTMVGNDLYVAERNQIIKLPNILETIENPREEVILKGLPNDASHGWKYLAQGPDEKLYFGIGAPCNVCTRDNNLYATINRVNTDGSELEVYASGIRNTVGFDWHPLTKELWFTENGRDMLGDNLPPDELNHAPQKGLHFGFPYVHGEGIEDPEFYKQKPITLRTIAPVQELGPHVAALGLHFYTGSLFPENYHHQAFIAEHGSWNRSEPIGYRISMVEFSPSGETNYIPFISGWLGKDKKSWGRPVDILQLSDGSLLISDDAANVIYRVWYDPAK